MKNLSDFLAKFKLIEDPSTRKKKVKEVVDDFDREFYMQFLSRKDILHLESIFKKNDPERPTLYIETGQRFRDFITEASFTALRTREAIDQGELLRVLG